MENELTPLVKGSVWNPLFIVAWFNRLSFGYLMLLFNLTMSAYVKIFCVEFTL